MNDNIMTFAQFRAAAHIAKTTDPEIKEAMGALDLYAEAEDLSVQPSLEIQDQEDTNEPKLIAGKWLRVIGDHNAGRLHTVVIPVDSVRVITIGETLDHVVVGMTCDNKTDSTERSVKGIGIYNIPVSRRPISFNMKNKEAARRVIGNAARRVIRQHKEELEALAYK